MKTLSAALVVLLALLLSAFAQDPAAVVSIRPTKVLSREGWTKQKVREYLAAHITPSSSSATGLPNASGPPKVDLNNSLMIVVAGGPGSFIALLRSAGPGFFENELVTKKIELPENWDKLVAKYKDLKPNYEKY